MLAGGYVVCRLVGFPPFFLPWSFCTRLDFIQCVKGRMEEIVETTRKAKNIHMNVISIDLISELACASELEWNQII